MKTYRKQKWSTDALSSANSGWPWPVFKLSSPCHCRRRRRRSPPPEWSAGSQKKTKRCQHGGEQARRHCVEQVACMGKQGVDRPCRACRCCGRRKPRRGGRRRPPRKTTPATESPSAAARRRTSCRRSSSLLEPPLRRWLCLCGIWRRKNLLAKLKGGVAFGLTEDGPCTNGPTSLSPDDDLAHCSCPILDYWSCCLYCRFFLFFIFLRMSILQINLQPGRNWRRMESHVDTITRIYAMSLSDDSSVDPSCIIIMLLVRIQSCIHTCRLVIWNLTCPSQLMPMGTMRAKHKQIICTNANVASPRHACNLVDLLLYIRLITCYS